MKDNKQKESGTAKQPEKFTEGIDFYYDVDGLMVLTAHFLRNRGHCCESGCRHCPYPKDQKEDA